MAKITDPVPKAVCVCVRRQVRRKIALCGTRCLIESKENRVSRWLLNPKSDTVKTAAGATVAIIESVVSTPGGSVSGVAQGTMN